MGCSTPPSPLCWFAEGVELADPKLHATALDFAGSQTTAVAAFSPIGAVVSELELSGL